MTTLTTRDRREALAYVPPDELARRKVVRRAGYRVNRTTAARDYPEARDQAAALGLELIDHGGGGQYTLRQPDGWLLHVYPGPRRLLSDANRDPRPPWLDLPSGWGLGDVVEAAGRAINAR